MNIVLILLLLVLLLWHFHIIEVAEETINSYENSSYSLVKEDLVCDEVYFLLEYPGYDPAFTITPDNLIAHNNFTLDVENINERGITIR